MAEIDGLQWLLLVPVVAGSCYSLLTLAAVTWFLRPRRTTAREPAGGWPAVSVLKPVHGLEKGLAENLRSTCRQDYPVFQVVLSVQRLDDPALPLLREIEQEFGSGLVTVVATDSQPVVNGKIQNLVGALESARHDVLVISDSDVRLRPDYLKTIVAPLLEPGVGCVWTLYRAHAADRWFEKLELLTLNTEFIVNVMFAAVTGASRFGLGASTALRRSTLEEIGGLEPLGAYLVEDFEMARRVAERGHRGVLVPYFVDTAVDLERPSDWWTHLVYWDQNTRAARPIGFFCTLVIRALPFALGFALARGFDPLGLGVLAAALLVRLVTAAGILARMHDAEGLRSLAWLPLRDLAGLAAWAAAVGKRHFVWRGLRFGLTRDGRIVPREASR